MFTQKELDELRTSVEKGNNPTILSLLNHIREQDEIIRKLKYEAISEKASRRLEI